MEFRNERYWKETVNGIYVSDIGHSLSTVFSMEQQERLMELEDDSWWFKYRASVILSLMDKFFKYEQLTLDVGGGNGYTTWQAMRIGYNIGLIEPSMPACVNAHKRGIKNINCGAISDETIMDESVQQLLLLDVLEHIEDDLSFVKLLSKKLVGGGFYW